MTRLLIVEDEPIQREGLCKLMLRKGWEVEVAGSVPEAERKLAAGRFDVVLADVFLDDLRLPGALGTDLLGRCGEARVVMMSAYGSLDSAVEAMKLGAVDYVTKPLNHDDLFARLTRAAPPKPVAIVERILLGESPPMRRVRDQVRRVAASDLSVLLLGESGTGKDLVAHAVHQQSARRAGPFVAFRCAAMSTSTLVDSELFGHEPGAFPGATEARAGLFESANGGTVFLDEVGKLPPSAQEGLLRVLQEREVRRVGASGARWRIDVRVVAATNRDLEPMVKAQTFCDDLFFRLQDFEIRLPPLRERGDDLFLLARHIIERACTSRGRSPVTLAAAAREAMLAYRWPGNVRELEGAMKCALASCDGDEIDAEHLPERIGARHLPIEVGAPATDSPLRGLVSALPPAPTPVSRVLASSGPVLPTSATSVFVARAPADEKHAEALRAHLAPWLSRGRLQWWSEGDLQAGSVTAATTSARLDAADLILFLVSADLLCSPPHLAQMTHALARHHRGAAHLVPVLVRACAWEESDLASLQPLPRDRRPVTKWPSPDEAWLSVVQDLAALLPFRAD